MLKIKVLVDNNTFIDRYFTGEPGFCLWLEEGGKKILFDTGYSGAFIQNANLMGIDLLKVDDVVLSHGHYDHTWGMTHLISLRASRNAKNFKPNLTAHPYVLERKLSGRRGIDIGSMLSHEILDIYFNATYSKKPVRITDKIIWTGEIPRVIEKDKAVGKRFVNGAFEDDYCCDDSALVYEARNGIVIMTGCSHAGICNVIDYARKITGQDKILDIIGGFHMLDMPKKALNDAIDFMSKNPPCVMHPCHCTDLKAKIEMAKTLNIEETGVGLELRFD